MSATPMMYVACVLRSSVLSAFPWCFRSVFFFFVALFRGAFAVLFVAIRDYFAVSRGAFAVLSRSLYCDFGAFVVIFVVHSGCFRGFLVLSCVLCCVSWCFCDTSAMLWRRNRGAFVGLSWCSRGVSRVRGDSLLLWLCFVVLLRHFRGAFAVPSWCFRPSFGVFRGAFAVLLRCFRGAFAVPSRRLRCAFSAFSRVRGAFVLISVCFAVLLRYFRGAFAVLSRHRRRSQRLSARRIFGQMHASKCWHWNRTRRRGVSSMPVQSSDKVPQRDKRKKKKKKNGSTPTAKKIKCLRQGNCALPFGCSEPPLPGIEYCERTRCPTTRDRSAQPT